jgi:hypothetical protein
MTSVPKICEPILSVLRRGNVVLRKFPKLHERAQRLMLHIASLQIDDTGCGCVSQFGKRKRKSPNPH